MTADTETDRRRRAWVTHLLTHREALRDIAAAHGREAALTAAERVALDAVIAGVTPPEAAPTWADALEAQNAAGPGEDG